jgi:thioredoxin-like negative regulator of GroEL
MLAPLALALLVAGPPARPAGIRWESGFDEALKRARAAGKPVMIDFWAEWCGWCHRLDQTTYVDPSVVRVAKGFVAVKVNTEGAERDVKVAERYDVTSLPTILFVSPAGRQLMRVDGFQGPGQFPRTLESALEVSTRVIAWEKAIGQDAKNAEALLGLGSHLFEQELYEDSSGLLYDAVRADRKRPATDRAKARMLLGIIQTYDRHYPEAERLLREALALPPAPDQVPRILFVLGRAYLAGGKREDAREMMQRILADHRDSPVAQKARETLMMLDRGRR